MTLNIGLTGGIGSGKTTVARIFEVLGIPVYYADDAAKQLMNKDPELRAAITAAFGSNSYVNGKLNRSFIAEQVFNDKGKLALLNSLTHPATIRKSNEWFNAQTAPYALKEAALIIETRLDQSLDFVIGVTAPEDLRIKRTMDRDGISREKVVSRMNNQLSEEEKMKQCDFVIHNDEETAVIPQVLSLHEKLLALANAHDKKI